MAKTVFGKLHTALMGQIHRLADKAYNTPDAYKQEIRVLEQSINGVKQDMYSEIGRRTGYQRKIDDFKASIKAWNEDIDLILNDGDDTNDSSAYALQGYIFKAEADIKKYEELVAASTVAIDALELSIDEATKIKDRMLHDVEELEMKASVTAAQNRTSSAIENISGIVGNTRSVDSIKDKIDAEKDKSDARLQGAIGSIAKSSSSPEQVALDARAKAAIEARKAELAKKDEKPAKPADKKS